MSRYRSNGGLGKVFLWIFLFPIMVTIAIGKSRMKLVAKLISIALIWVLFLGAGKFVSDKKTDENTTSNKAASVSDENAESTQSDNALTTNHESAIISDSETVTADLESQDIVTENGDLSDGHVELPGSEALVLQTDEPSVVVDAPEETDLPKEAPVTKEFMEVPFLKGRGVADFAGVEPNYVDCFGYVAVYTEAMLEENPDSFKFPWNIPVYSKTETGWDQIGTIKHKTKIGVISQELTKKNAKDYQGYLQIQDLGTGDIAYINVHNFVTSPYWEDDILNAIDKGYVVAAYDQVSKYKPVYQNGSSAKIDNDIEVLLPAKGTYFISAPDRTNYQILGIVFSEKDGKTETQQVFFNREDLSPTY